MTGPVQQTVRGVVDGTLGVTAVSSPWWANFDTWLGRAVLVGGAILLLMRLIITWRELWIKKTTKPSGIGPV